jgi:cell volume regulation protein A
MSWVGLRGAVPVVLALFPLIYSVENARLYFNVAFFIVLVSLLLQGWTIATSARLLRLEVPPSIEPTQRVTLDMPGHFEHEIVGYQVDPGSLIAGRSVRTLGLPEGLQLMAVIREGRPQALGEALRFEPGDYAYVLGQPEALPQLAPLFDPHRAPDRLEEHSYFGDFVLNGDALLGELADAYGLEVPQSHRDRTLAGYLDGLFRHRVVVGDRAALGSAQLVVREIRDGRVSRVGLKIR